jgi:hypothetical protein
MKKTRDEIIADNPVEDYCEQIGIELKGTGNERKAKCPFHKDDSPSFSVNISKQVWQCLAGCGGGSVIDLLARHEGISIGQALQKLSGEPGTAKTRTPAPAAPHASRSTVSLKSPPVVSDDQPKEKFKFVCAYDYRDAKGDLSFQACRMQRPNPKKPAGYEKTFMQRRPAGKEGVWFWNMEGVERVLYQLPKILKTQGAIVVAEGEKDCDNLYKIGFVATTNVGGAGKWMEPYSDVLKDREVILCGDNDDAGRKHTDEILKSLAGKAKSVRLVRIPEPFKDVTEFLNSITSDTPDLLLEKQFAAFSKLVDESPVLDKGLDIPIQSMGELEVEFISSLKQAKERSLEMKVWLPKFHSVRPIVAGELITIIAATKVGKTAIAQNLMMNAAPLKILNFQQELPESLSFERFVAMGTKTPAREVYHQYISQQSPGAIDWRGAGRINHIYSCHKTRLTPDQIEELIVKSELKIGERPAIFVVDYIQLCGGKGKRYENVTDAAEGMKVVAKRTKTIGIVLSQRGRAGNADKEDQFLEVKLTDGKESGGIENSSGLVLGAWRDESDKTLMIIKVLANTKGFSGLKVPCDFDGETLTITQREEKVIEDKDVPA